MVGHLIDVPVGWDELGTDLLDGVPADLRRALVGDQHVPSTPLDDIRTMDGKPAQRMLVTHDPATHSGAEWGYVLRDIGIEVIPTGHGATNGPIVAWTTSPLTRFSDTPHRWQRDPVSPAPAPALRTRAAPRPSPSVTATHTSPPPRGDRPLSTPLPQSHPLIRAFTDHLCNPDPVSCTPPCTDRALSSGSASRNFVSAPTDLPRTREDLSVNGHPYDVDRRAQLWA
ncbi:hypothetical protein [Actinacidiphila sp. bgisy144]|uniref:hypothetical protein n=1 Tax=Actinacidiphila sp. bgisy144 TaxID=3413791 RepID=UPI003EBB9B25